MFRRRRKDEGIYLGYLLHKGRATKQVRYRGGKHLITIGPNGSFKGMGLIVPNLATLPRSVFVVDPKGEALSITGRKRAELGRVVVINPFGTLTDTFPHMKSQGFNPLTSDVKPGKVVA
jgi:type IV secretion system protein VirD4